MATALSRLRARVETDAVAAKLDALLEGQRALDTKLDAILRGCLSAAAAPATKPTWRCW